jgi:hypothetical protein
MVIFHVTGKNTQALVKTIVRLAAAMKEDNRINWLPNATKLMSVVCASFSIGLNQPCSAQSGEQIETLVNNAKILPSQYKIRAYVHGPEATVVTYRNPKAQDQDCKIDAILIAQKVMKAYKPIAVVRTQFCYVNKPTQYDQIEIHAGDVKSFGSGGLTKQRLLDSLPIAKSGPGAVDKTKFLAMLNKYQPVPGFALKERKAILENIKTIQNNGGDATDYWNSFENIESKVKAGLNDSIIGECNLLTTKAFGAAQNSAVVQAKQQLQLAEEHNKNTSKLADEQFVPHVGPMYKSRLRLAQQVHLRYLAGDKDVKRYQMMLVNYIEGYMRANDIPHLKAAITDLERQMNLTPVE